MTARSKTTRSKAAPAEVEEDARLTTQTRDIVGKLTTQSGPRTAAPMWPRPLLTVGEWAVYTALWSHAGWSGDGSFPSHQKLADRAWVERGTAANAVRRFDELGLLTRLPQVRSDGSTTSNTYMLIEICPAELADLIADLIEERATEQAVKRSTRRAVNRQSRRTAKKRRASTSEQVSDGVDPVSEGGTSHSAPPSEAGGGTSQDVPVDQSSSYQPSSNQPPPPPSPPPHDGALGTRTEDEVEEEEDPYGELERQLVASRPDWSPSDVHQVLTHPDVRSRPRELVERVCMIAATRRGNSGRYRQRFLRGILAPGCPLWEQALTELEPPPAEAPPVPRQRGECTDSDCVNGMVTVVVDGRDQARPCETCQGELYARWMAKWGALR